MEVYKNSKYSVSVRTDSFGINLYDGVAAFQSWYEVQNRETGVTEHRCPTLPEALSAAHNLEDQLLTTPWVTALANQKKFQKSMEEDFERAKSPTPVTPIQ